MPGSEPPPFDLSDDFNDVNPPQQGLDEIDNEGGMVRDENTASLPVSVDTPAQPAAEAQKDFYGIEKSFEKLKSSYNPTSNDDNHVLSDDPIRVGNEITLKTKSGIILFHGTLVPGQETTHVGMKTTSVHAPKMQAIECDIPNPKDLGQEFIQSYLAETDAPKFIIKCGDAQKILDFIKLSGPYAARFDFDTNDPATKTAVQSNKLQIEAAIQAAKNSSLTVTPATADTTTPTPTATDNTHSNTRGSTPHS